MRSFKLLGLLLAYPNEAVVEASHDIVRILRAESLLSPQIVKALESFIHQRQLDDLLAIQEQYVDTFDRGRAHSLHLFEHVHGESRDRGQAMVDLMETYAAKDLYIDANELPDYLPLFLEYLSMCPLDEAVSLLGEAIDIIAIVGAKLHKRKSPYAVVFDAIESLSEVKPDKIRLQEMAEAMPKDPETLDELDEQWKEAAAFEDAVSPGACAPCGLLPETGGNAGKAAGGIQ